MRDVSIKSRQLFPPLVSLVVFDICFVSVWHNVSPELFIPVNLDPNSPLSYVNLCVATNAYGQYFEVIYYGYKVVMMFYLMHLGYLTRKVHTLFNDSDTIKNVVYSLCITTPISLFVRYWARSATILFVFPQAYVLWNVFFLVTDLMPFHWFTYRNDASVRSSPEHVNVIFGITYCRNLPENAIVVIITCASLCSCGLKHH